MHNQNSTSKARTLSHQCLPMLLLLFMSCCYLFALYRNYAATRGALRSLNALEDYVNFTTGHLYLQLDAHTSSLESIQRQDTLLKSKLEGTKTSGAAIATVDADATARIAVREAASSYWKSQEEHGIREALTSLQDASKAAEERRKKREAKQPKYPPNVDPNFVAQVNQQQQALWRQQQQQQMQQQQLVDYDNEYPAEAVDDMPGPAYVPPPDPLENDDETAKSPLKKNRKRREAVIDAFKHSWQGYVKHAWGKDELQPRSKTGKNWAENPDPRNGLGLTVLDSLSTIYLMGLHDEMNDALEFIKTKVSFNVDVDASVFESTIRMLGGLLSLYELRGEKEEDAFLLERATELADRLLFAYNTTSGIPHSTINLGNHHHYNQQWNGGSAVLAEFGTVQLEFRTLAFHTGNPVYDMKVTHLMDIVEARAPRDMLCPVYMSSKHASWTTDHVSMGAMGDSFYEYLLKQFLLTGKTEQRYKKMYKRAAYGIVDKLVFKSRPSGRYHYLAEYRRREFYHKQDHLACFAGGMLAVGAHEVFGVDSSEYAMLMETAEKLVLTCTDFYFRQKSGVSPELVEFPGQGDNFINGPGYYILRPETFESLYYMWHYTRDEKWRDYGWRMFRAIVRWCKVESGGFSGIREVNVKDPIKDNLMQSFWFAETLKYAYLLFTDEEGMPEGRDLFGSSVDLANWVFNTEGHPLRRRKRDPIDVWRDYEKTHGGKPAWLPPRLKDIPSTSTEAMQSAAYKPFKGDPFGEELDDGGVVEDDGGPFDQRDGWKGVPRPGAPKREEYAHSLQDDV